jgi:hypothetical protein
MTNPKRAGKIICNRIGISTYVQQKNWEYLLSDNTQDRQAMAGLSPTW